MFFFLQMCVVVLVKLILLFDPMLFVDKACLVLLSFVVIGPLCSFLRNCGYLMFDLSLGIKEKLLTGRSIITLHVLGRQCLLFKDDFCFTKLGIQSVCYSFIHLVIRG
jgi:hypothetical protein